LELFPTPGFTAQIPGMTVQEILDEHLAKKLA
jgi:hypothetical protein